jgi:predicted AAA+ superfamily ATPase
MRQNPYRYNGPLDPVKDALVCIPRDKQIKKVIEKIVQGDYCAILGPRQIGKTTFLRQLQINYTDAHYIYFNFEVSPKNEETFYQWMKDVILEEIPAEPKHGIDKEVKHLSAELKFLNFLMRFSPRDGDKKKIIFLFDEIEAIPDIRNFLHIWRKIYIDQYNRKQLNKYLVIITGSVDLIKETNSKTSPFNIAHTCRLENFSVVESKRIIDGPFKKLNIEIEKEAKKKLLSQISGHPQLLQHACYKLVDITFEQKRKMAGKDVDDAIKSLFKDSSNLDTLRHEVRLNQILESLIRDILKGEKHKYLEFKEFSVVGTGPIIEDSSGFCTLRSEIYKEFLADNLGFFPDSYQEIEDADREKYAQTMPNKKKPKVFICYSHEDDEWRELLYLHLKVLDYQEVLFTWDDQKIIAGQYWSQEIEDNMNTADIAVLLISKDFLTSDFIMKREIPFLLERRKNDGINIFPLLVRYCYWERIPWLKKLQIRPQDSLPLSDGDQNKQDLICVQIVKEIAKVLEDKDLIPKNELENNY